MLSEDALAIKNITQVFHNVCILKFHIFPAPLAQIENSRSRQNLPIQVCNRALKEERKTIAVRKKQPINRSKLFSSKDFYLR